MKKMQWHRMNNLEFLEPDIQQAIAKNGPECYLVLIVIRGLICNNAKTFNDKTLTLPLKNWASACGLQIAKFQRLAKVWRNFERISTKVSGKMMTITHKQDLFKSDDYQAFKKANQRNKQDKPKSNVPGAVPAVSREVELEREKEKNKKEKLSTGLRSGPDKNLKNENEISKTDRKKNQRRLREFAKTLEVDPTI